MHIQGTKNFKLCKVHSVQFGSKGIPYINTYDGRTIRYPDPLIKTNDTIKLDLESNKIVDFIKFDVGNVVMVTGGRNTGRVGILKNREKHKASLSVDSCDIMIRVRCQFWLQLIYFLEIRSKKKQSRVLTEETLDQHLDQPSDDSADIIQSSIFR
ncbi:putative ribosomal protein S4e [Helianthus anomalus]